MPIKIGFPRGLVYYEYYPFWEAFFSALGAEIIVSGETNKKIVDQGVKITVDEACLPVKTFHGHVESLKGRTDFLFLPRCISMNKREYNCPKMLGLTDMVRNSISDLPPLIDIVLNKRKGPIFNLREVYRAGRFLTSNPIRIFFAYRRGIIRQKEVWEKIRKEKVLPSKVFGAKRKQFMNREGKRGLRIALIGHPYMIYDGYVNMGLIDKLESFGVQVYTPEMFVDEKVSAAAKRHLPRHMFWTFGTRFIGSALYLLERKEIDGIIFVMSFGCGLDSFISDLLERRVREIPYTVLTLDEHTGQAGIDTRIEAFVDMVRRREAG